MASNILIVDDSESIREAISLTLESAGYTVTQAWNGHHALEQLGALGKVDLLITDLNMPNLDGIGLVREVRKSEVSRFMPILILTTESQDAKRHEARMAGATGWIVKPFSSEQLLKIIRKVVR